MVAFLNKFRVWVWAGIGALLYWLGRKDEKVKQIDETYKGQLHAIKKAKVAQVAKYESDRIKRLHDKYRRR